MALRTCDIVMKGGITSGVVYPKAISKLAERFRFVNIGGTSAGAIAAAVTAAAEYRRQCGAGTDNSGFSEIDKLGNQLMGKVDGGSMGRLLSLFTPNAGLGRVFRVLLSGIGHNPFTGAMLVCAKLILMYFPFALIGILPGAILAFFSYQSAPNLALSSIWVTIGVIVALAGALLLPILIFAIEFVFRLPKNGYGICNGMTDEATPKGVEPLTVWLGRKINESAGMPTDGRPLTFKDLYLAGFSSDEVELWDDCETEADRKEFNSKRPRGKQVPVINLEMITTNLTHGRPYRLPFRDDDDLRENHLFYFNEQEFRRLFPKTVVDHMVENARPVTLSASRLDSAQSRRDAKAHARYRLSGYHAMPKTEQLPVVVAMRMSLSFPVLLSAVPLYSLFKHRKDAGRKLMAKKLERCWFTDGGVCSNFPLHFFDGPMPRRPTFSLDLNYIPDDAGFKVGPWMANSNEYDPVENWNRFESDWNWRKKTVREKGSLGKLIGFGGSFIETMRTWNDSTQSRLPGYRDRIVTTPLTTKQGGLNLNMPEETLKYLLKRGAESADLLLSRFDVPPKPRTDGTVDEITWDDHRWVRLRTQLAAMERMVEGILEGWDDPESNDKSYEKWLRELLDDETGLYKKLSYKPTKKQLAAIIETIEMLKCYPQIWNGNGSASSKAPKPRTRLRHRAQI